MNPRNAMTIVSLLCLSALAINIAHAADVLAIAVGQVSVVRAGGSIGTVAVGDPSIADVAIEGDNSVMVFGKKAGQTDLVLMSNGHRLLLRSHIIVSPSAADDSIVIRRPGSQGVTEEAWYCTPTCARAGAK
jgi:Flp pilus assembly secretin CpaC